VLKTKSKANSKANTNSKAANANTKANTNTTSKSISKPISSTDATPFDFSFVFQNEFAFIVDKPHGWLTTPGRDRNDTRPCLGRHLQTQLKQQIFPVHRLDFEVSGLTLWAKSAHSHKIMQAWFEFGNVRKVYQAFSKNVQVDPLLHDSHSHSHSRSHSLSHSEINTTVPHGSVQPVAARSVTVPRQEYLLWESKIVRGKRRSFEASHGQVARTQARVVAEVGVHWKWELIPLTGRPHQLRFEMRKRGFPIVGDQLYGGELYAGELVGGELVRGEPASLQPRDWIALRAVALDFSSILESERLGLPEICEAPALDIPAPPDLRAKE
jgi:tRNA pseudouridine32 synthase / 23S rRNA pseudouridine746 synthase